MHIIPKGTWINQNLNYEVQILIIEEGTKEKLPHVFLIEAIATIVLRIQRLLRYNPVSFHLQEQKI